MSHREALALFGGKPAVTASIARWPSTNQAQQEALVAVLATGKYHRVNHPIVSTLEDTFSGWSKGLNVRAVSSATAAIHIALDFWKRPHGRVLVSALNWPGAVGPIFATGMQPLFADVTLRDGCLDDGAASALVGDTNIILATHLYGNVNRLARTREKARDLGEIAIVDDCAQGVGVLECLSESSRIDADAFTVSGNGSKHLGAGELGLLCSDNPNVIGHVDYVSLSSSSRDGGRVFSPMTYGYNYRPNVFSASLALSRIPQLSQQLAWRRRNSDALWGFLKGLPGLYGLFNPDEACNSFCMFPLRVEPSELGLPETAYVRDRIVQLLAAEGIPASVWLQKPVWEYLPFPMEGLDIANFPNTGKLLRTMFHITEIASPNEKDLMQEYADAFHKVWNALTELKDWLVEV